MTLARRSAFALVAAAVLLVATACADAGVPEASIDVGTPELVRAKAAAGVEPCAPGPGPKVVGGMPSVDLPCLGGGRDVDVSSLRGPMLVSIWAYWCQPCRDEMPVLQAFYAAHGDRVPVLGIDYLDTQPGGALSLMESTGATYPTLADPSGDLSAQAPLPAIRGLPFLLLIDADGKVAFILNKQVTSRRELLDLVDEHLGVRL
jgi:thiol-disulfide isomerase/thioredoxin